MLSADPLRHRQLDKGLRHLTEEGVAQLFIQNGGRRKIVGALQFELIQYRLAHEYGADCRMESLPYARACWITSAEPESLREFIRFHEEDVALDKDGQPVYLAESEWALRYAIKSHPRVEFHFTSELDRSESRLSVPEWQAAAGS